MTSVDNLVNIDIDDVRLPGETCMNCLKRKMIKYIKDGNSNNFRSAKEWFDITGLCGFKDKTCHHYAIMTYLVNNKFVERHNNKLRLMKIVDKS